MRTGKNRILEVCCADLISIQEAVEGGAQRVELCEDLEIGGITPSTEMIDYAIKMGIRTHILIRPRGGNFVYSPEETELPDLAKYRRDTVLDMTCRTPLFEQTEFYKSFPSSPPILLQPFLPFLPSAFSVPPSTLPISCTPGTAQERSSRISFIFFRIEFSFMV